MEATFSTLNKPINSLFNKTISEISDDDLVSYFATRNKVVYPELPEATGGQLKYADAVLSNRFTYTGETFQFLPGFSWKPNPSTDKEWQIAFHKHYFLIDLIQAYRHSGNPAYLAKWRELIESWIAEMGSGHITLSDAQVEAKRMESWCTAFMLLNGTDWHHQLDGRFLRKFLARISEESYYISQNLKRVRNHRTFQLYAIYLVGVLFPELTLQPFFLKTGTDLLSENLLTDFHPDGVHIEMSSHYHQLVAETGVRMLELAVLNNLSLSRELIERLHKAVRFSLYLQWPNGDIPLINDSDNGNHLDLLRLGSRYFDDPELLWGATLGKYGQAPKAASICFPAAGYYILGDHWGDGEINYAQRQHLFYDCGKLGEGSHSHYDLFNFCYFLNGKPAIIDPGRYTYSGEPDAEGILWRHYFKGTSAHNTVTVDRQDQTKYLNRTKHGPEVLLNNQDHFLGKYADWIDGQAISENYSPRHERLFVYMEHRYVFILDRLYSDDGLEHHYELNFHLPAETKTELTQHGNCVRVITDQCQLLTLTAQNVNSEIKPGWVSRYYGIKHPAPIVSVSQTGNGDKSFASIAAPLPDADFAVSNLHAERDSAGNLACKVEVTQAGGYFTDFYLFPSDHAESFSHGGLEFKGKFAAYRQDAEGKVLFLTAQNAESITLHGKIILTAVNPINFEWAP